MPGENNMNGSENGTDNGQSTQGFRGTESIGFVTNEVVTPGQTVHPSNEGYNASTEQAASQNVVETARKEGEASIQLQEISARISGNPEASAEVRNPAVAAIEGIKRFAEWRRNVNAAAADRERERYNKNQYSSEFVKQSQTVGENASQFITQQGNAARAQEQLRQPAQNNLLGRVSAGATELFTNIAGAQLERSVRRSERLENGVEARRWRNLLAKSEGHKNKAEFYGRLAETLNNVMNLFTNHGANTIESITSSRRNELENQRIAQTQNVAQAQNQYGAALQGQMGASYSGR